MENKERMKPIPEELNDGTLDMVYGGVQSDVEICEPLTVKPLDGASGVEAGEITNQLLVSDDVLISKYSGTEVKAGDGKILLRIASTTRE